MRNYHISEAQAVDRYFCILTHPVILHGRILKHVTDRVEPTYAMKFVMVSWIFILYYKKDV